MVLTGKVPEWSNGPHSKCGERATVPGVRIPPFPPDAEQTFFCLLFFCIWQKGRDEIPLIFTILPKGLTKKLLSQPLIPKRVNKKM